MSHVLDILFLLAFLIVPAWLMSRSKRLFRMFAMSSLLCWIVLLAWEGFIGSTDPTHNNIGGASMMLLVGWLAAAVYCAIWTGVLSLGRWLDKKA
jgi:hypothetical protein